jgi:hypothetical protein
LAENASAAADSLALECSVEKVTDVTEIVNFGVMMTPALVIDGEVRIVGRSASVDEIKDLLTT